MRVLALALCLVASPAWAQVVVPGPSPAILYPPESEPILPTVPVLWATYPAPALDLPSASDTAPVKLLFVFPSNGGKTQQQAIDWTKDLNAWDNVTLANSLVGNRYKLVGTWLLTNYADTGSTAALNWMKSGTPAGNFNPQLEFLRTLYGADEVVMPGIDGGTCGYAFVGCSTYGKQWCFAYVTQSCAKGNFSANHELCHTAGCLHDTPNASGNTPLYLYAFGFCGPDGKRDPTSYPGNQLSPGPCNGPRQPYFGNQDLPVSIFGYIWGDATHENAKVLQKELPKIAAFYPDKQIRKPSRPKLSAN